MSETVYSDKILQEFPYVSKENLNRKMMINVLIAMCFPTGAGFYYFGISIIRTLLISVGVCVLTEWLCTKVMKKETTINDLTAVVTGVIIALNMRPGVGAYPLILANIIGITVGKMIFGGAGFNPINPALLGRLVPVAGFPNLWAISVRPTIPNLMDKAGLTYWEATQFTFVQYVKDLPFYDKVRAAQPAYNNYTFTDIPNTNYDVLSGTTYLETVKQWYKSGVMPEGMTHTSEFFDYGVLFFGNMSGVLGETAKWAILLGFLYLVITKTISPLIPILIWIFMGIFGWIFTATRLGPLDIGPLGFFGGDPLIWVLVGGVMFGSVYMETDPVSSPRTTQAKVLYSLVFVSIVTAIRLVFSFPEGVSFALLSANILIPFFDKLCNPENKYALQIKRGLITSAIIIVLFLTGVLTYTKFLKESKYVLNKTKDFHMINNIYENSDKIEI